MATVVDLAQLTDGDTGVFASAKTTGPNPYIPHIKASWHSRGEDGKGKPKAFPLPFGEVGSVTAIMRRGARDEGVSIRFRWIADDMEAHAKLIKGVEDANAAVEGFTAAPSDPAGVAANAANKSKVERHGKTLAGKLEAAQKLRDASPGKLHFQVVPQITRQSATAAAS